MEDLLKRYRLYKSKKEKNDNVLYIIEEISKSFANLPNNLLNLLYHNNLLKTYEELSKINTNIDFDLQNINSFKELVYYNKMCKNNNSVILKNMRILFPFVWKCLNNKSNVSSCYPYSSQHEFFIVLLNYIINNFEDIDYKTPFTGAHLYILYKIGDKDRKKIIKWGCYKNLGNVFDIKIQRHILISLRHLDGGTYESVMNLDVDTDVNLNDIIILCKHEKFDNIFHHIVKLFRNRITKNAILFFKKEYSLEYIEKTINNFNNSDIMCCALKYIVCERELNDIEIEKLKKIPKNFSYDHMKSFLNYDTIECINMLLKSDIHFLGKDECDIYKIVFNKILFRKKHLMRRIDYLSEESVNNFLESIGPDIIWNIIENLNTKKNLNLNIDELKIKVCDLKKQIIVIENMMN